MSAFYFFILLFYFFKSNDYLFGDLLAAAAGSLHKQNNKNIINFQMSKIGFKH